MHFIILADIWCAVFVILVTLRITQFFGPWDTLGTFLHEIYIPVGQFWSFVISCILFYMSFDYTKLKECYIDKLFKRKTSSTNSEEGKDFVQH